MEAITQILINLADKYPLVALILTLLSVLVIIASLVVKAFPAVDRNGRIGKIVAYCDFLSVFYPKWKTSTPLPDNDDEQSA